MAMNYMGIMYFPLNVNFFEDKPIELIEAKYGLAGIAAVMKLLCKLHKESGYYLKWDEEQCMLFAHKAGLKEECMDEIISILVEKGFFDKASYESKLVLTSINIQRVWLEATKRRKRDLASQPYLMDELKTDGKSSYKGDNDVNNEMFDKAEKSNECMQKPTNCIHNENIFPENADNFEQSKVKQKKVETEGGSPAGSSLLTPPGYVFNKQTHNYDGLLFTLKQMRITDPDEVNTILRLSDYGRLKGYVWQVIHATRWGEVAAKGKYLIAALVKDRKRRSAAGG